ncbi:hypothetical protein HDV00_011765, partial [Rhizophlyctis rosea]
IAERAVNAASKRSKGKSAKIADLQVGDWVRLRLHDDSGIAKKSKTGCWTDEIYEITGVYTPRKIANLTQSFRIKNKDTGEQMKGLYSLGQLLPIPKDTETLPERPHNPPPINPDETDPDLKEWELDSIISHRIVRPTRTTPRRIEYKVKYTGYKRLYWESEENLQGAQDMLQSYKRLHELN